MLQDSAIVRSALVDSSGYYRYALGRQWQPEARRLTILMLNPSRADDRTDDPTIRRCMALAQGWGFGAITVVNLFAYRTAYPRQLREIADPIGPENDDALITAATQADLLLLAWGNSGHLYHRDQAVLALLKPYQERWCAIARNQTGHPCHPLYVRRDVPLRPWADFD